ncbi:MAG: lipid A export permease/ATP-binding protein MsbA [Halothiobacillus sp. 20-53-49]|nr:lipid A export permease/ATP-binding protein MsbA [Halothiobacillaceae bacterium]OYV45925.1 MAG: lipid A export permease/ATP-binding protein MsbA [Halothiobacillus sp. 20-53-49]HUM98941.1 lipid A export permease/ATP-binding protein MsbA [Halothiobacillus sp.]
MSTASNHPASGWQTYRRLLVYTKQYWRLLALAILGMIAAGLTEVAFAALMKPLLDGSFVNRDPATIHLMPLLLLGVFAVRVIAEFASGYGMAWVGRSVIRDLKRDVFDHVLHLPVRYFDHVPGGDILTRLNYQSEQVSEAASSALTTLIRDTITVLGLLVWLLILSWQLALFIVVLAPVLVVLVWSISRAFRRYARRIQDSMGQVSHVAEEVINGHRVVKLYGGEAFEAARFAAINAKNFQDFMRMQAVSALSSPLTQFVLALGISGIVWFATTGDRMHSISVGTFVSFITALSLILSPMKRLIGVNAVLQRGIAAGESLFGLLDEPREHDPAQAVSLGRASGQIRFEGVGLRYQPANHQASAPASNAPWVLSDITLTIPAGKTVALVGRSGAGKSSLIASLPRFVDIERGVIRLDGIDINTLKRADLRRQFAYVSQDTVLFNTSVAANIGYSDGLAADQARIIAAAKAAFAFDFIEQLPEGFNTPVGENGVLLSGGQRQRLAIARALYRDAPILILDEATSALDTESERYIQAALENLSRGRTTLVIAHRLSTIEHADLIVVLDQGRVIETGSHADLLSQEGAYAALHRLQFNRADLPQPVR